MNLTGGIVLYAVLWFLTMFVVLPFGGKTQAEAGHVVPGTHEGAPAELNIKGKVIITTIVATVLWGIIAYVIFADIVTRADLVRLFG